MQSTKESAGVDKQGLWGWWHKSAAWQNNLHRKAAHKALDIEEDPVIVSNRGVGAGGLVAAVLAGGLGPVAIAALLWWALQGGQGQAVPSAPAPPPPDAEYEVRFYDAQGNEIQVDRWPGRIER